MFYVVAVLVVSSIVCSAVVLGAVVLSALLAKGEVEYGRVIGRRVVYLPSRFGGQHSNRAQHKDALRGGGHGRGRGAGATDNGGSDGDAGELARVAGLVLNESQ